MISIPNACVTRYTDFEEKVSKKTNHQANKMAAVPATKAVVMVLTTSMSPKVFVSATGVCACREEKG